MDFVEEVELHGANHYRIVVQKLNEWAVENERPEREFDSLRCKFDKLSNAKKKTVDPSCPPLVRRAKHIARNIQAKCAAVTIGDSTDYDG